VAATGPPPETHLTADLVVVFVATDVEVFDVGRSHRRGIGDRRRVEQPDQLGEALGVTVVRSRRREQERIGARRQQVGEAVAQRPAGGHVVALVDDHRVPVDSFEVVAVAADAL